jgi:hypothetical protein
MYFSFEKVKKTFRQDIFEEGIYHSCDFTFFSYHTIPFPR